MKNMDGRVAVRSTEEIRVVLQRHRQKLQEIAESLEADECRAGSYFTSTEKEEAWALWDTLSAEVATLEWVLMERDSPAYPVEDAGLEVSE
jgi:hypothetical protein